MVMRMKKAILLVAGVFILTAGISTKISAESIQDEISQDCYESVKECINTYYSEEYQDSIEKIYKNYHLHLNTFHIQLHLRLIVNCKKWG